VPCRYPTRELKPAPAVAPGLGKATVAPASGGSMIAPVTLIMLLSMSVAMLAPAGRGSGIRPTLRVIFLVLLVRRPTRSASASRVSMRHNGRGGVRALSPCRHAGAKEESAGCGDA
jgi:hypothetical protein